MVMEILCVYAHILSQVKFYRIKKKKTKQKPKQLLIKIQILLGYFNESKQICWRVTSWPGQVSYPSYYGGELVC